MTAPDGDRRDDPVAAGATPWGPRAEPTQVWHPGSAPAPNGDVVPPDGALGPPPVRVPRPRPPGLAAPPDPPTVPVLAVPAPATVIAPLGAPGSAGVPPWGPGPPGPPLPRGAAPAAPPAPAAPGSRALTAVLAAAAVLLLVTATALWVGRNGPGTTGAAAPSPAARTTPAPAAGPAAGRPGAAAATGTDGPSPRPAAVELVRTEPAAAAHPSAAAVSALLTRHFTAINDHDYEAWSATVVPRRIADQPRGEWDRAFRSTRDSDVVVSGIAAQGGGLLVDLSFVSEQDVADAPPDVPAARICWTARWPVAAGLLDRPVPGSTTRRAC